METKDYGLGMYVSQAEIQSYRAGMGEGSTPFEKKLEMLLWSVNYLIDRDKLTLPDDVQIQVTFKATVGDAE